MMQKPVLKTSKEKVFSVIESLLFMSPEPRPLSDFEKLFSGEFSSQELESFLKELKSSYEQTDRGLCLENINKGWQLRTKAENKNYLLKIKPKNLFRLSRSSLEALSIIAFEGPCPKIKIDEVRGVDSGHLLRSLMEKGLIHISGKSDLPGKASLYKTTSKFLEVFGLKSLKDLPSQQEIEELQKSPTDVKSLNSVSQELLKADINIPYEEDEQENKKIKDSLKSLPTTVDFLEKKEPITDQ